MFGTLILSWIPETIQEWNPFVVSIFAFCVGYYFYSTTTAETAETTKMAETTNTESPNKAVVKQYESLNKRITQMTSDSVNRVQRIISDRKTERDDVTSPSTSPTTPKRQVSSPRPPHTTGIIRLILGPMAAGKSDLLNREINVKRVSSSKRAEKCLVIRYRDTRFSTDATLNMTRNKHSVRVDHAVVSLSEIPDTELDFAQYIFVDEGQFFPDLCTFCLKWARKGKEIQVSALDSYANQTLWPSVAALMPFAEYTKHPGVCDVDGCGERATLTFRRDAFLKDEKVSTTSKIEIGEKDVYTTRCIFHTP